MQAFMKKIMMPFALAMMAMITITSCRKTTEEAVPVPGSVDQTTYLQLSANGVQLGQGQLYALVSVNNEQGQEVVSNKKVTLDYIQGVYKTDRIILAKGSYTLSKFIVTTASDTAVYAAPKPNSAKAALVSKPVSIPVSITETGVTTAAVQVLKVEAADSPASFGYTVDDFGKLAFKELSVKLMITVGETVYDSLPGKLVVDASSIGGQHWIREIELQEGVTQIRVPENYETFSFQVAKWNTSAQKTLSKTELGNTTQLYLTAVRQPKLLVEESTFIENGAGLIPDTRTEYLYNANNRLSAIKFYQKQLQSSNLPLTSQYQFVYNGMQLDTIKRFNPDNNTLTGFSGFTYAAGKIATVSNGSYDQTTNVIFNYSQFNSKQIISADYLFNNGNSMTYTMQFRNGNLVSDKAISSTGGGESSVYSYDSYINPKNQLGYPDIFLSNSSKNNRLLEQKIYSGSFPSIIPYKTEFIYNADGYPVEEYVSYKGYTSQQHVYRIKKVYRYQ